MSISMLHIERTATGVAGAGANVVFDSIPQLAGNVSYSVGTGAITFVSPAYLSSAGRYRSKR